MNNQEVNKNIYLSCTEKLRTSFYKLDKIPLFVELSVYFKELHHQIEQLKFENDWKSYYFEFGSLFALIDIIKTCFRFKSLFQNSSLIDNIFNYDFDEYIFCDDKKKIEDVFEKKESFISILRSMIIAHPINDMKIYNKTTYWSLNQIDIDESFDTLDMPKKVRVSIDHIKFKIQKYYLGEQGSINDLFSIVISNKFFGDYYYYLTNLFCKLLNTVPSERENKKKKLKSIYSLLKKSLDNREKLAIIKTFLIEEYQNDISYGFLPFEIKYINALLKNYDDYIGEYIIINTIESIKSNDYIDIFKLKEFETESKDYKWTTYWFERVDLLELINWDKIRIASINYNPRMENERFIYFFNNFLFNALTSEEIFHCRTYYDLLCKIIRKNISLKN